MRSQKKLRNNVKKWNSKKQNKKIKSNKKIYGGAKASPIQRQTSLNMSLDLNNHTNNILPSKRFENSPYVTNSRGELIMNRGRPLEWGQRLRSNERICREKVKEYHQVCDGWRDGDIAQRTKKNGEIETWPVPKGGQSKHLTDRTYRLSCYSSGENQILGKNGAAGIPCGIPGKPSVSEQFSMAQRCGECAALRDKFITKCAKIDIRGKKLPPDTHHNHAITAARLRARGCKKAAENTQILKRNDLEKAKVKEQEIQEEKQRRSARCQEKKTREERKLCERRQAEEAAALQAIVMQEDLLNNNSTAEEILAHSSYANKVKNQKSLKKFQGKIKKKRDKGKKPLNNLEQKLADYWNASSSWIN